MDLNTVLLCNAAEVRDGMLFVMGGGVSWIVRPQYPAPLMVTLALGVTSHQTETKSDHTLEVIFQDADGKQIARVQGNFSPSGETLEGLDPADELFVPVVLPLALVPIPTPGRYSFEILIDGTHKKTMPLTAKVMS